MRRSSFFSLTLCFLLMMSTACGGGEDGSNGAGPQGSPTGGGDMDNGAQDAACEPQGDVVRVVAEDNAFDSECYASAANKEFRIEMTNRDTFEHNFSIYKSKGGERLFQGPYVQGTKTQTLEVGPQPPQRAYFVCDIHPQMEGVFIFS